MKKAERQELIRRLAFEYAASGRFENWYRIELALRRQGFREARTELDRHSLREQLDEVCRSSKPPKS